MDRIKTLYPGFNVMAEHEHWDDHTREIVQKRLETPGSYQKLTGEEVDRIRILAALFVDDGRSAMLDYIVKHFDNKLASDIGEAQRKAGVLPQHVLIKQGLAALELLAKSEFQRSFTDLTAEQQITLLVGLENNTLSLQTESCTSIPSSEFFKKMLSESVSAYYSHPQIWSEIGYAGPAYPRGYVRSELGLTDPWEARRDA
ncbi:MAG: gluconate 2-dehydrogenase subunit 3 family protein [Tumebacillaceae bacterium]